MSAPRENLIVYTAHAERHHPTIVGTRSNNGLTIEAYHDFGTHGEIVGVVVYGDLGEILSFAGDVPQDVLADA